MPPRSLPSLLSVDPRRSIVHLLAGCTMALLAGQSQAQATNTPPAGYTLCAAEWARCSFSGTTSVVYGARTSWSAPRSFTGGVNCNNTTFGDVLPGVVKSCYVQAVSSNVIVRARGQLAANVGPVMQLRVNGVVVGSANVLSTAYTNYSFNTSTIPSGARVDVVFVNDYSANGEDRNLFVESITIGGVTIPAIASSVSYDIGAGLSAFDGINVLRGQSGMAWNGALRFTYAGVVASTPTSGSTPSSGSTATSGSTPTSGSTATAGSTANSGSTTTSGSTGTSGSTATSGSTSTAVIAAQAEAARFLTQATFGPNMAEIQSVATTGPAAWMEQQFNTAPMDSHWQYAMVRHGPPGCTVCNASYINSVMESFWLQAVRGPDQLRQRTAFALSELFVVSNTNSQIDAVVGAHASYLDMLSRNAFGNFRTLLEQVATHPAMGQYLSHFRNEREDPATGRLPDENFAREVMQLFTIGLWQLNPDGTRRRDANGNFIPTYVQDDVAGMARVFSGWGWGGPDRSVSRWHG